MNPHRGSDFNEFLIEQGLTNTNQPMTPTPRTDAMRLKMTQLGWPSDGEPVALLMASHAELERELADKSESLAFQTELNREVIEREKQTFADLLAEREQVAILRSDERRLSEFAKDYRKRADEAEDKLAAERALADRLATWAQEHRNAYMGQVPHQDCGCGDCQIRPVLDADLTAWKEARQP